MAGHTPPGSMEKSVELFLRAVRNGQALKNTEEKNNTGKKKAFHCNICNIKVFDAGTFEAHLKGKKHRIIAPLSKSCQGIGYINRYKHPDGNVVIKCELCGEQLLDVVNHLNSSSHILAFLKENFTKVFENLQWRGLHHFTETQLKEIAFAEVNLHEYLQEFQRDVYPDNLVQGDRFVFQSNNRKSCVDKTSSCTERVATVPTSQTLQCVSRNDNSEDSEPPRKISKKDDPCCSDISAAITDHKREKICGVDQDKQKCSTSVERHIKPDCQEYKEDEPSCTSVSSSHDLTPSPSTSTTITTEATMVAEVNTSKNLPCGNKEEGGSGLPTEQELDKKRSVHREKQIIIEEKCKTGSDSKHNGSESPYKITCNKDLYNFLQYFQISDESDVIFIQQIVKTFKSQLQEFYENTKEEKVALDLNGSKNQEDGKLEAAHPVESTVQQAGAYLPTKQTTIHVDVLDSTTTAHSNESTTSTSNSTDVVDHCEDTTTTSHSNERTTNSTDVVDHCEDSASKSVSLHPSSMLCHSTKKPIIRPSVLTAVLKSHSQYITSINKEPQCDAAVEEPQLSCTSKFKSVTNTDIFSGDTKNKFFTGSFLPVHEDISNTLSIDKQKSIIGPSNLCSAFGSSRFPLESRLVIKKERDTVTSDECQISPAVFTVHEDTSDTLSIDKQKSIIGPSILCTALGSSRLPVESHIVIKKERDTVASDECQVSPAVFTGSFLPVHEDTSNTLSIDKQKSIIGPSILCSAFGSSCLPVESHVVIKKERDTDASDECHVSPAVYTGQSQLPQKTSFSFLATSIKKERESMFSPQIPILNPNPEKSILKETSSKAISVSPPLGSRELSERENNILPNTLCEKTMKSSVTPLSIKQEPMLPYPDVSSMHSPVMTLGNSHFSNSDVSPTSSSHHSCSLQPAAEKSSTFTEVQRIIPANVKNQFYTSKGNSSSIHANEDKQAVVSSVCTTPPNSQPSQETSLKFSQPAKVESCISGCCPSINCTKKTLGHSSELDRDQPQSTYLDSSFTEYKNKLVLAVEKSRIDHLNCPPSPINTHDTDSCSITFGGKKNMHISELISEVAKFADTKPILKGMDINQVVRLLIQNRTETTRKGSQNTTP